ncbi:hypothetical protein [Phenylobacterium sp.]|uniref:hypothetical protein n=1 Tax=Phenylobacterium sp. TaxID=1871053 RepID=UPI002FCA3F82
MFMVEDGSAGQAFAMFLGSNFWWLPAALTAALFAGWEALSAKGQAPGRVVRAIGAAGSCAALVYFVLVPFLARMDAPTGVAMMVLAACQVVVTAACYVAFRAIDAKGPRAAREP